MKNMQEDKSKCCGAELKSTSNPRNTGYFYCSKCGKPFIPQPSPKEEGKSFHSPCTYGNDDCPKCSPQDNYKGRNKGLNKVIIKD